ncbi:MAG: hypothetical protein OEY33_07420 [Bdellovibrionales bacterium]|nr:hypothetical protein [Bdellovibrionales bacterium]
MNTSIKTLVNRLSNIGLDIIWPFQIKQYNQLESVTPLPTFKTDQELGLLLGFSKKFWDQNIQLIDPGKENPFDDLVTEKVKSILKSSKLNPRVIHYFDKCPDYISFQKLADITGLAHLGPSHLLVHEKYGMWFSLRMILLFEDLYTPQESPHFDPCLSCERPCLIEFNNALEEGSWKSWVNVRKSCPVGKRWMYSDNQINYHYTKDKKYLSSNN